MMRKIGLIEGIKSGRAYRFDTRSILEFLDEVKGKDISNENTCRLILLERGRKK
jgi:hypothetical protein